MALGHGAGIVRSGLVLHLDAANTKSYPGSGTAWNDLSNYGNSGTLANGVGYNSNNGGGMIFDGSNDEVICTNNPSLQITTGTISAWFKANNQNTSYRGIITKQTAWGLFVFNNTLIAYDWGSSSNRLTGITVGNNTTNYVAMSFTETIGTPSNNAIVYVNGVPVLTTTVKHSSHGVGVQIGEANAAQHFNGSIFQASVYNRVLTTAEVRQNFEAFRGRYDI